MAQGFINFKPKQGAIKKIGKFFRKVLIGRIKNNFANIAPVVEKALDVEISKKRDVFIPNDSEAAELGVGEGGRIDKSKINNAWKILLPSSNRGITRVFSNKNKSLGKNIGKIRIIIDDEEFFMAPETNIKVNDKIGNIPWMDWYLNGETIGGYTFSSAGPVLRFSRTGGGIMIFGGTWKFTPRYLDALQQLVNYSKKGIEKRLATEGAQVLGK